MTGFRLGPPARASIVQLYHELGSVGAVAAQTGRHRNTVRRVVAEAGLLPEGDVGPSSRPTRAEASQATDAPRLGGHEQRLLQALLRSAQLYSCRTPECATEFATFALETRAGKRLRTFCPACGRGATVRIASGGEDESD